MLGNSKANLKPLCLLCLHSLWLTS